MQRQLITILGIGTGLFFWLGSVLWGESPVTIQRDAATETYTFEEDGQPVFSYHFGAVPFPEGEELPRFSKGDSDYDGAYFTDGSTYGGERSDYIHPVYGFSGETLTEDFPSDERHHRGIFWSWCEVRWNDRIGDLWAVDKIRAYPVEISRLESNEQGAFLEAVNVWRFDGDATDVVRETVRIHLFPTIGNNGVKSRIFDINITLEPLVDGLVLACRQKVDYGGYGGLCIRVNGKAPGYSLRVVHPNPDKWRGDDNKIAERIVDPSRYGSANWLAVYAKYPVDEKSDGSEDFTTVMMMESTANPDTPNNFRYYSSGCLCLAFPGWPLYPMTKGTAVQLDNRFRIRQGKSSVDEEYSVWREYQQQLGNLPE